MTVFLLNPSSLAILWKIDIKKKATLNDHKWIERLRFSESLFNFLLKERYFLRALPAWVNARALCPLQPPGFATSSSRGWKG